MHLSLSRLPNSERPLINFISIFLSGINTMSWSIIILIHYIYEFNSRWASLRKVSQAALIQAWSMKNQLLTWTLVLACQWLPAPCHFLTLELRKALHWVFFGLSDSLDKCAWFVVVIFPSFGVFCLVLIVGRSTPVVIRTYSWIWAQGYWQGPRNHVGCRVSHI